MENIWNCARSGLGLKLFKNTFFAAIFFCSIAVLSAETDQRVCKTNEPISMHNPLKGFASFAIYPLYSITSPILRKEVEQEVFKELGKIGKIVRVDVPDVRGFGDSGAFLTLSLQDVFTSNHTCLPALEISLTLDALTVVKKTGGNYMTPVWTDHTFSEGNANEKNLQNILAATRSVLKHFVDDYLGANSQKEQKVVFYFYTP